MQVTAEMLIEAFCQTQREVLAREVSFEMRWERIAALLNEKLASKQEQRGDPNCEI